MMSTYKRSSPTKTKQLWLWMVLIVAVMLASSMVVAASTQAHPVGKRAFPPTPVLMKGKTALQKGAYLSSTWHYYDAGRWETVFGDGFYSFPRADSVRAGTRLHIRISKDQKPERFRITAYKGLNERGYPVGEGKRLNTTLKPVKRDGKTVAWKVFFRVNEPERHYYLGTHGVWKRVPGTHISYGNGDWNFHVKTAE